MVVFNCYLTSPDGIQNGTIQTVLSIVEKHIIIWVLALINMSQISSSKKVFQQQTQRWNRARINGSERSPATRSWPPAREGAHGLKLWGSFGTPGSTEQNYGTSLGTVFSFLIGSWCSCHCSFDMLVSASAHWCSTRTCCCRAPPMPRAWRMSWRPTGPRPNGKRPVGFSQRCQVLSNWFLGQSAKYRKAQVVPWNSSFFCFNTWTQVGTMTIYFKQVC